MNRSIRARGQDISEDDMRRWEMKRLRRVSRQFSFTPSSSKELAALKLSLGQAEIMKRLSLGLAVGRVVTKLLLTLSRGRYRLCVVEIAMPGLSAEEAAAGVGGLMEDGGEDCQLVKLAACPDHHLFHFDGETLEVVETTGGAPFPTQMFVRLGEVDGLPIEADPSFPIQVAGLARMPDGTVMGGIRHQFRNEGDGFRVKLCIAFPRAMPAAYVRAHELHLACEFSNWFDHLIDPGFVQQ